MSEGAGIDRVAVFRVNDDAAEVFGIGETEVFPTVAAIARPVDTGSDRHAVTYPGLAGADPNSLRIGGIDGERADRLGGLFVKDGLEGGASVGGLPHAATGGANVDSQRPLTILHGGNVRNMPPHRRGANRAGRESTEGVGINDDLLRHGKAGQRRNEQNKSKKTRTI